MAAKKPEDWKTGKARISASEAVKRQAFTGARVFGTGLAWVGRAPSGRPKILKVGRIAARPPSPLGTSSQRSGQAASGSPRSSALTARKQAPAAVSPARQRRRLGVREDGRGPRLAVAMGGVERQRDRSGRDRGERTADARSDFPTCAATRAPGRTPVARSA